MILLIKCIYKSNPSLTALSTGQALGADIPTPVRWAASGYVRSQRSRHPLYFNQHEPWFPDTLVPLKVQKRGGFQGPGSSFFKVVSFP